MKLVRNPSATTRSTRKKNRLPMTSLNSIKEYESCYISLLYSFSRLPVRIIGFLPNWWSADHKWHLINLILILMLAPKNSTKVFKKKKNNCTFSSYQPHVYLLLSLLKILPFAAAFRLWPVRVVWGHPVKQEKPFRMYPVNLFLNWTENHAIDSLNLNI